MGHDFKSWWTGSLLNIEDTRRHVPHQNATTLQVAIGVVAAAIWMFKNPKRGLCLPDDIDHQAILDIAIPFISPYVPQPVDWTPIQNADPHEDVWQFKSFFVGPSEQFHPL